jgi:beta-aspartyl-peptidase (threonine type)
MKKIAALLFVVLFAATIFAQKSDERATAETTFSGRNLTRGWQTVLENYKKNYDTPEKMGKLSFGELEITPLSKDAAYVFGTWKIEDGKTNPGGRFTLIFRRFKEGWRIVHDQTS